MSTATNLIADSLKRITKQPVFLSGSRFFMMARVDSDYDFYTQYSPKVSKRLEYAGFILQGRDRYGDSNTQEVWRNENVDVQLVRDLVAKTYIDKSLLDTGIMTRLHLNMPDSVARKEFERKIWDVAYTSWNMALIAESWKERSLKLKK